MVLLDALVNAPALLNLLDGPVGVDPAFHIVWSRFRMMRRFPAYCPGEEPRIFRMLDLISRKAHGPVHLLLISAAELGFAWDGDEKGWVRVSLRPLRMMTGPVQHFRSAILDAWRFHAFAKLSERQGFFGIFMVLYNYTSSHLRERDKMWEGGVWNGFLHGKAKKEDVPCRCCGKSDGGHFFWECPFHSLQHFRVFLNSLILCLWIEAMASMLALA